jgi:hypothetical protein
MHELGIHAVFLGLVLATIGGIGLSCVPRRPTT